MKTYLVEHNRGVAGVDEKVVEREIVRAGSEREACEGASFNPAWPWREHEQDCANPEGTQGGSGRFNDYISAVAGQECPKCGAWLLESEIKCDSCSLCD